MMPVRLSHVLIPTAPRRSIDARVFTWIARNPYTAVLIAGWVVMAVYLFIYFQTGAWCA